MYIYIFIHVYIYICIYICMYIYFLDLYIYIYLNTYISCIWLRHSQPRFRPSGFVGQSEFAELHAKAWNAPWQNLRVSGFYHQSPPLSHIWGPQPNHFCVGVGVGEREFGSSHLSAGSSSAGWATFYVKPWPTPMSLLDHTCNSWPLVCPKPSLFVRNPHLLTGNSIPTPSSSQCAWHAQQVLPCQMV